MGDTKRVVSRNGHGALVARVKIVHRHAAGDKTMKMRLRDFFAPIARVIAARRRQADFTCGDCERSERCGQAPSDTCVVAAAQMERGDWRLRRQARALARTVGPI